MSTLICYDGSPSARRAVEVARQSLGSDRATLLHVFNPPVAVLADSFSTSSSSAGPNNDKLEHEALARARQVAEEGRQLAHSLGVEVDVRVERNPSSVWRTILDVALEQDARLIVVGTHGATAVTDSLLGSVSSALLHHSEIPVLIAPAHNSGRPGPQTSRF
jgi:nucleotide-binding universal stress UspA family protein